MKKWLKGKKDSRNKGSTIIVVLIAMTFLTVLATVLLYLSLVNLQMKKMDKAGKVNFYSAEAVMNEIRAGVQEKVSDAIKGAYTDVLISYDTALPEVQVTNFRNYFVNKLFASAVGTKPLFPSATTYDPIALKGFLSSEPIGVEVSVGTGAKVTPDGLGAAVTITDANHNVSAVILKNVSITYTSNNFQTWVSTDIRIEAPVLPYTSTTSKQTAIPDFAIVARGALQQPGGVQNVAISGNVYAGSAVINGGDNLNVQKAPYFVVNGPVTVNGGLVSLKEDSSLWANDIKLDIGGKITVAGDAYIKNDLNLYGNLTQATLSGRYFGFGDSLTDPALSSSIIINGKSTVLDMSKLRAIMLAGHSFVNYGTGSGGNVLMGESISAKSNQMAYLVPDNCLASGISNPYKYTGADPGNAFLQTKVLLDQKIMNNKTLWDYGIKSTADNIYYIRKQVGNTNIIYFCLKFTDIKISDTETIKASEWANAYFKDYYNANNPLIQKYLDLYSNGISLQGGSSKNLAGDVFTFDGTALGSIVDATNVPPASISEIAGSYANLCVTLSRTEKSSVSGITAYEYFANTNEVASMPSQTIRYPETASKVIVTRENKFDLYADDQSNKNVHIVIALHDVEVHGTFNGLILAGGNVIFTDGATVTASRAAVADALQELTIGSGSARHYLYLNPQVISPMNVSTSTTGQTEIWDMNKLVAYENWKKNEG